MSYFADDWEEDVDADWEDVDLDKKVELSATAKQRVKFGMVEDAFNKRWKELVTFGLHIMFDESMVAGWYTSSITIGPEPKHIRIGVTLHLMCVTFGPLSTYKLHVCAYGRREDEEMNRKTKNVKGNSKQKFINLLEILLPTSWVVVTLPQWIQPTWASSARKLAERCGSSAWLVRPRSTGPVRKTR